MQAQDGQVESLKKSLVALEGKIAEAKTKKDMLKARAQAAKAQQQLQSAVGNIGTDSAMAAFERMEEKVEALEATARPRLSWLARIWRVSSPLWKAVAVWMTTWKRCALS